MRTPTWQDQEITKTEGFKIVLSFEEEHINPKEHFIGECGMSPEEYSGIKNYYWFVAKVSAYRGSIECGSAYIGGNCYKNLKEVLSGGDIDQMLSGYMPQLIEEATEEAITALAD